MSVYIKGMEMPFCCLVCPCSGENEIESEYVCEAAGCREITEENKINHRPDWCPLIPVPDHGRLIDADALLATERETFEDYHISEATTVIPADEEEQT